MSTRPINTHTILAATLAAVALLALAPAQAQVPAPAEAQQNAQKMEAKIDALQSQVSALQAQVKQLQAQLRASNPSAAISPFYRAPNLTVPNLTVPNISGPGKLGSPNIQGLPAAPPPSRYNSIPNYTATYVAQPAH